MKNIFSNMISGNICGGDSIIQMNGVTIINGQVVGGGNMVQGNGNLITKEYDITNKEFSDLKYSMIGTMELKVNPELKGKEVLTIQVEENLAESLRINTDGGNIELGINGNISPSKSIHIVLHTSSLSRISSSATGAINGEYEGSRLNISISGVGQVELIGNVDKLKAKISGTGKANLRHLEAKDCDFSLSGASNAEVYASESADISVSGVGNIVVYGSPPEYYQSISGVGNITKIEASRPVLKKKP